MKIAIVKLSALGDIVHAMVALQFIKAALPDCQIDWLVEQRFAGVLADNPDIHQILPLNLKAVKQDKCRVWREWQTLKTYAQNRYDWVIDAQGLVKSAIVARLLSRNTAGFDRDSVREKPASLWYRHRVACAYDANTIDRNATVIAQPLGIAISPEQILHKQAFLHFHAPTIDLDACLSPKHKHLLFVIGSTWASRNYPKAQYLNVIEQLAMPSWVCWGSEQELADAEWLAARSQWVRVLPKLSLNDLKAVMARVDLVIGNDTGPTHCAWGLNKPSITLFGPTPVSRVYQTPINKVLKSPSVVNPFKLNKNDFSIREIPEQAIVALARRLLG